PRSPLARSPCSPATSPAQYLATPADRWLWPYFQVLTDGLRWDTAVKSGAKGGMNRHSVYRFSAPSTALLLLALRRVLAAPAQAATDTELLQGRPFAPTDRGLFVHAVYPDTPADVP